MKILSAIVLSFIFATGVYAEMATVTGGATSEPTVKYEVTFKVVYNAVSAERAAEISKEIMTKYQDACKVSVKMVKADYLSDINYSDSITLSQPQWIYIDD